MKVPDGLDAGLIVNSMAGGYVEIGMVSAGKVTAKTKIAAKDAGLIAGSLLDTAKNSSPGFVPPPSGSKVKWLHMHPTTVSLAESPIPNSVELVLSFGPATLGVAIKNTDLKQLGQAMLALSADGEAQ